jgi:hypothetical protein
MQSIASNNLSGLQKFQTFCKEWKQFRCYCLTLVCTYKQSIEEKQPSFYESGSKYLGGLCITSGTKILLKSPRWHAGGKS